MEYKPEAIAESHNTGLVPTVCQLCSGNCGLHLHLDGGKIVKVTGIKEHPVNKGRLCPKALAVPELVYSGERLRHPLKRDGSSWKEITWDEALDTVASRLETVRKEHGPRSLAVTFGMSFLTQGIATIDLIRRFTDVYGTPNVFSVDSMCYRSRLIGYILTGGKYYVADPENSRCILLWGNNPEASCPPVAWRIAEARKRGAALLVIDPRQTPLAKKADIHLQPRPGTDGALALGIIHTIIQEELFDRDFVSRWASGLEELKTHAASYSPEKTEAVTGVPAEKVRELARAFASKKPACIVQGTNTLDQQPDGVQNSRSVAILQALTGNLDIPGGFISPPRLLMRSLRLPELLVEPPLGIEKFPLFYEVMGRNFGECQAMLLPDTILSGKPYPVKAMVVTASNPLVTWPDSTRVRQALEKLDFLVVMDMFMTETAKLAHIVLPAASFAERLNIVDMFRISPGLPYVMLRQPAVKITDCRSDMDFWLELAHRMGYREHFPWESLEEVFDYMLEPAELSVESLKKHPAGLYYGKTRTRDYEKKGFHTPSGKIELYSDTLLGMGHEPLPLHREDPRQAPGAAGGGNFPLLLTTGARNLAYLHSQFHAVPRLRKLAPEAVAEVNSETAARFGLADGEECLLETVKGSIKVRIKAGGGIIPGVVQMSHGWPEANVNLLTSLEPADPVTGNPALKVLPCRLRKAA
ncbi:MAG: molybdopterin-dependent oxidoreductase [Dehalococcoidia bacterium]|nr:molybdopterin-dependent oxidoreductase [Dehalococcoidia bacterium]